MQQSISLLFSYYVSLLDFVDNNSRKYELNEIGPISMHQKEKRSIARNPLKILFRKYQSLLEILDFLTW